MDSITIALPKSWKALLVEHKDALLCIIDQGVVSIAGLTTSVLIGRHAPAELGTYYIALSIVLFIRGFQEQMISVPYTIFHHQHQQHRLANFQGSCLVQQLGLTFTAICFLGIMMGASLLGWVETTMAAPIMVLVPLIPALLMRELIRQYCFTHQRNMGVLAIDFSITMLQISGIVALGYLGMLSGAAAWGVIGIACLSVLTYWYVRFGPAIAISSEQLKPDWQQNWSFAKWAAAGQLVGSLPTYILPWMLAAAAGTEGTGFFAAGMTLVGVANIFNNGMANFLTPKASQVYIEQGADGLRRVILKMFFIFLVAIGGFVLLLAILGGWIASELLGSKYDNLQMVMTLLGIAKLFESFSIVASNGLFVLERIRENFMVDLVLMTVTIIVAIILIFPLGVIGAVWTSLVAAVASAVLRFALLSVFLKRDITGGKTSALGA